MLMVSVAGSLGCHGLWPNREELGWFEGLVYKLVWASSGGGGAWVVGEVYCVDVFCLQWFFAYVFCDSSPLTSCNASPVEDIEREK